MRSGWPHNHGSYLPRGGLCDAGEPGTRQARSRRLGAPAEGRSSRSAPAGTGAEQVWCGVTAGPGPGAARRAGPRSGTASGEPGRGRAGPARDLAVNQVSARRAGPVTRLPPARPRPAAMCHPVAVVRMAGMIIVVVPADPAACPALPRQASIERRIAESGAVARRPTLVESERSMRDYVCWHWRSVADLVRAAEKLRCGCPRGIVSGASRSAGSPWACASRGPLAGQSPLRVGAVPHGPDLRGSRRPPARAAFTKKLMAESCSRTTAGVRAGWQGLV
jgi:hypothetical protein